jgi:pre-60S factor REI1
VLASQTDSSFEDPDDFYGSGSERRLEIHEEESSSTDEPDSDDDAVDAIDFDPKKCLFCNFESSSLESSITHMQKVHGLFIPDQKRLLNLESFLGYLFAIVADLRECLFCGKCKGSLEGVQQHMRDKGHCKISAEEASQLGEFYDTDGAESKNQGNFAAGISSAEPQSSSSNEDQKLILPLGRAAGHRSQSRYYRQNHHPSTPQTHTQEALTDGSTTAAPDASVRSRQLMTRSKEENSLIGLSSLERRAVRVTERKALRSEARARNEYRASIEKIGNKQKYFKVSYSMICDGFRIWNC